MDESGPSLDSIMNNETDDISAVARPISCGVYILAARNQRIKPNTVLETVVSII